MFIILQNNNIFIKSKKIFLDYFNVQLLNQKINSFDLITTKDKLKIIFKLHFSRTLRQLKTYFNLIEEFREYIFYYANIAKFLQNRKTKLLRFESIVDNARKFYTIKIKMRDLRSKKSLFSKHYNFYCSNRRI